MACTFTYFTFSDSVELESVEASLGVGRVAQRQWGVLVAGVVSVSSVSSEWRDNEIEMPRVLYKGSVRAVSSFITHMHAAILYRNTQPPVALGTLLLFSHLCTRHPLPVHTGTRTARACEAKGPLRPARGLVGRSTTQCVHVTAARHCSTGQGTPCTAGASGARASRARARASP